jgi:lysophospholipase L1-like esterase
MKSLLTRELKRGLGARHWVALALIFSVFAAAFISPTGALTTPTTARATSTHAAGPFYYLSLGDSLAVGEQPNDPSPTVTLHGFSNDVVTDLASKVSLTLENFGCGGATSSSVLTSLGCSDEAADGVPYTATTMLQAAINFIDTHPGQVKLITVEISANDYAPCVISLAPPASCVSAVLPSIESNIKNIAGQLRAAAGPSTVILGLTDYLDALAYWLNGPTGKTSAKDWIAEFRSTLIPALQSAYAPSKGTLVNIIADSGSYIPLKKTVSDPPYGKVPLAVARNCTLVWMCASKNGDAHPTTPGYSLMARAIAKVYLQKTS